VVYRITGALFFGATASVASVLDRIGDEHQALVLDLAAVPFLDATGANMIKRLAHSSVRRGVKVYLSGTSHDMRRELFAHAVKPPLVRYAATLEGAVAKARAKMGQQRRAA
jgi:SulP family sulfate permease